MEEANSLQIKAYNSTIFPVFISVLVGLMSLCSAYVPSNLRSGSSNERRTNSSATGLTTRSLLKVQTPQDGQDKALIRSKHIAKESHKANI